MRNPQKQTRRRGGFTLVEILIVVVILGILAVMVLPLFADLTKQGAQATFVSNLRICTEAAMLYNMDTGEHLEDSNSGELPAGLENYIDEAVWTRTTSIGGVWDFELDSFGVVSAFGVHFNGEGATRDDAYMLEIDLRFDDGDLSSGVFRKLAADRYYVVLLDE